MTDDISFTEAAASIKATVATVYNWRRSDPDFPPSFIGEDRTRRVSAAAFEAYARRKPRGRWPKKAA